MEASVSGIKYMNTVKKNWPFLLIALISLGLGVLAVLTAIKLKEEKPIAPTAPRSRPKAVEGNPVTECQTSFTLALVTSSPSPSPSTSPGTSPSPTPSTTPGVPKAGTTWPTAFLILGAAALLLFGIALP